MNTIKSLFIPCIDTDYDADYIINAFYCKDIATISRITLLPFNTQTGVYNKAYLDIAEWHESEAAYELVNTLKSKTHKAIFAHHSSDDNWCWTVGINKKESITRNNIFTFYTTENYLVQNCDEPWVQNPWNTVKKRDSLEFLAFMCLRRRIHEFDKN
jgi:hypothetical protein